MTTDTGNLYVIGFDGTAREHLAAAFDRSISDTLPDDLSSADVVILDARGSAGMPHGNAFSACRQLKRDTDARVYVAVPEGDPFGAETARFCTADDSLIVDADGQLIGLDRIAGGRPISRPKASVDEMLARLEAEIATDEGRQASAMQRMLDAAGEALFLERLTDVETGLFDGPYAAFKLDEEIKRAERFHQPLSLVLIDLGVEPWPTVDADRRVMLAEFASIFLNHCRDIDVLARFTDRVFLMLLPGTGPDGASTLARRMIDEIEQTTVSIPVEIAPAVGIVTVPQPELRRREALLARAEACLKIAKKADQGERICSAADLDRIERG